VNTSKLRQPYFLYLLAISLAGFIIVVSGLSQIPGMSAKSSLLLIICLAVSADIFATSSTMSEQAMAIEVGTAVSMALIPLFSPQIAAISAATCSIGIWLVFSKRQNTQSQSWEQLSFNAGMLSTAMFIAGVVFIYMQQLLGAQTLLGQTVPWLAAAIVYDQINFWMLMGIIRLNQGAAIKPVSIWIEHLWALPINLIVLSVGSGSLAFAAVQLGLSGIFVFFLPILLSAYAFRLYVRHMQAHMDNLENIVAERTATLKKMMQEKDAFLAVLTHDMKSPITTIHLYANMIKEHPRILEKKPHMIDTVLRSQEALINIVNNILDLEKLKADGQVPMEKETFDYVSVAQKVIDMIRIQAEAKKIGLQLMGFDKRIFVYADRHHMERILSNLVSNAIKYTPAKGEIIITLDVRQRDNELCLQVQDSGYGIPEEELPYVFDRFRRVSSHQKLAAGTGLGLAITKALVEAHGGDVEVMSQKEQGSTFTVHLPIIQSQQRDKKEKATRNYHNQEDTESINKGVTTFISY